jgi:hypothetical protein
MPLRNEEICYGDCSPNSECQPSIKVWIENSLVLRSHSLKIELEHSILHIKDNFITIEHK